MNTLNPISSTQTPAAGAAPASDKAAGGKTAGHAPPAASSPPAAPSSKVSLSDQGRALSRASSADAPSGSSRDQGIVDKLNERRNAFDNSTYSDRIKFAQGDYDDLGGMLRLMEQTMADRLGQARDPAEGAVLEARLEEVRECLGATRALSNSLLTGKSDFSHEAWDTVLRRVESLSYRNDHDLLHRLDEQHERLSGLIHKAREAGDLPGRIELRTKQVSVELNRALWQETYEKMTSEKNIVARVEEYVMLNRFIHGSLDESDPAPISSGQPFAAGTAPAIDKTAGHASPPAPSVSSDEGGVNDLAQDFINTAVEAMVRRQWTEVDATIENLAEKTEALRADAWGRQFNATRDTLFETKEAYLSRQWAADEYRMNQKLVDPSSPEYGDLVDASRRDYSGLVELLERMQEKLVDRLDRAVDPSCITTTELQLEDAQKWVGSARELQANLAAGKVDFSSESWDTMLRNVESLLHRNNNDLIHRMGKLEERLAHVLSKSEDASVRNQLMVDLKTVEMTREGLQSRQERLRDERDPHTREALYFGYEQFGQATIDRIGSRHFVQASTARR